MSGAYVYSRVVASLQSASRRRIRSPGALSTGRLPHQPHWG